MNTYRYRARLACSCTGAVLFLGACATYHPQPLDPSSGLASSPGQLQLQVREGGHPELPRAWRDRTVNVGDGLDETEVALLAVLNSPMLRAARMQSGEARARLIRAGLLPDPQFSTSFDFPTGNDPSLVSGYNFGLGIDLQSLITRGARRSVAMEQARATYLHILWQEWQVIQQARMLYRRILLQQRQITVLDERLRQTRTTLTGQELSLVRGNATLDQQALALAPVMNAQSDLVEARRQYNVSRHDLALLTGLSPEVALPLLPPAPNNAAWLQAPPPIATVRTRFKTLVKRRPDLLALKAGYRAQEANVRLQILYQFPGFTIGANRLRDTGGVWTLGPFVNLNLPVFNANRGHIAIARATRARLHAVFSWRLQSAQVQASKTASDQSLVYREWRQLTTSLPKLESTYRRVKLALQAGEVNMLTFTTIRNAYFSQRMKALRLEQAVAEQQVALETLLASSLPVPDPRQESVARP